MIDLEALHLQSATQRRDARAMVSAANAARERVAARQGLSHQRYRRCNGAVNRAVAYLQTASTRSWLRGTDTPV